MTPEAVHRSREVVEQVLDLITTRLALVPDDKIHQELIALVIGLQTWAMTLESGLPELDRVYTRQLSAELAAASEFELPKGKHD
ncbi:hypothetical protein LCGC14_0630680 [marine sediment metagenome]|uniref:Uncharacterized protein n=1 Tax=marine sediment metagenome TaxID=412755 RepID=A0A0F9TNF3_9ZZZZ